MPNDPDVEQQLELTKLSLHDKRLAQRTQLGIGLVIIVALIGITYLLANEGTRIADVAYARGLITVLFSIGVVAIAFVMVLNLILQQRDKSDFEAQLSEKRFQRTKEILTLLLGILGTIVGFYFGTSTNEPQGLPAIAEIVVTEDALAPGDKVSLTILIKGGNSPYVYSINFEGLTIASITGQSSERWVKETFTVPPHSFEAKQLKATIKLTDANNRTHTLTKTFKLSDMAPRLEAANANSSRRAMARAATSGNSRPLTPVDELSDFDSLAIDDNERAFN